MANKKITRPQYLTADSYDPKHKTCFEECLGESQTIKGESYTIKELMQRHLKMNFPNVTKEGFYADLEDFDMPDLSKLNTLDLVDRQAVYEEIEARARIARKKIEDHEKEAAQIAKENAAAIANNEAAQKAASNDSVPKESTQLTD